MNYNNLCFRCFCEKPIRERPCPKCGYSYNPNSVSANCLMPGTLLKNRYIVGMSLGVGGFGITYKCLDTKIGGVCAIKEYFPANFALRNGSTKTVIVEEQNLGRYNKIMKRFVEEAKLVKNLHHPNVITIYDNFFENNTAYYVMEYCDGIDLRRYTNNFARKLNYDEGMNLLYQIMNGLEYIHAKGILHRDIAPDNIYVTKNNTIKILDFGSARREMDQLNRELSVIVKVGYAPIEQYGSHGKQGPYTDIYALGATFYHLFTAQIPIESTQRVAEDNLRPFSELRPDLPDNLKYCIEKAMELTISRRISDIAEMKRILGLTGTSVEPPKQKPPRTDAHTHKSFTPVLNKAGISARAGAYMVDMLLWGIVYFGILFGAFGVGGMAFEMGLLYPVIFMLINTVCELAFSATLGKLMLGMRVSAKSGEKAAPAQILLRNTVKLLGVFVLASGRKGELLEDRATNSVVYIKK